MNSKRRVAAMLLIIAGIIAGDVAALFPPAEQLVARNTTTITTGERPAVTCGVMGCSGYVGTKGGTKGGVKGTGAGGGGTIHVGS